MRSPFFSLLSRSSVQRFFFSFRLSAGLKEGKRDFDFPKVQEFQFFFSRDLSFFPALQAPYPLPRDSTFCGDLVVAPLELVLLKGEIVDPVNKPFPLEREDPCLLSRFSDDSDGRK